MIQIQCCEHCQIEWKMDFDFNCVGCGKKREVKDDIKDLQAKLQEALDEAKLWKDRHADREAQLVKQISESMRQHALRVEAVTEAKDLREALEQVAALAGSNTIMVGDPTPHNYSGIYSVARKALDKKATS